MERLTDSQAFDDQATLSPDNRSVAFVSSRDHGSTDIYVLDLASRNVRNLTNAPGGDFRPGWSPDGQTIAFTSDRGTGFPHAAGRWEHLQAASVYVIRIDGTGLRRLTTDSDMTAGSPKWSDDGTRIVFYQLPVKDTHAVRVSAPVASEIVSIDVATGARRMEVSGPGVKLSPQFLGADRIAFLTKSGRSAALTFTSGPQGAPDDIMNPAWSRDGTKVVYHTGQLATMHHYSRPPGAKLLGSDRQFDLVYASGFPTVSPDGLSLAVSERVPDSATDRSSLVVWDTNGGNPRRIFQDRKTVMGLQWARDGGHIAFGAGSFGLPRASESARIMIIKPDGSGARAITTGPGNAGFPSWSPDGTHIVYRFWTDTAQGLRIVDVATGQVRVLTTGYDTLPSWSPKDDRIVFSRRAKDNRFPFEEFDIYSIRADGTDLKRLTDSEGDDAHPFWSPDGTRILWGSSRFGFKDEAPLAVATPQPYAELFIMNADGSDQRPLTDNQYEDGTPAWLPSAR